jgi:hypothetical protein
MRRREVACATPRLPCAGGYFLSIIDAGLRADGGCHRIPADLLGDPDGSFASIRSKITPVCPSVLAIGSQIMPIPSHILPVVPQILAVLLQLPGVCSGLFILSKLLPIMAQSSLVLPEVLAICPDVPIVLTKFPPILAQILAVIAKVPPILPDITPILPEILTIVVTLACRRSTLGKDYSIAEHHCRQRDLKHSAVAHAVPFQL